jgi:hypothetical protein
LGIAPCIRWGGDAASLPACLFADFPAAVSISDIADQRLGTRRDKGDVMKRESYFALIAFLGAALELSAQAPMAATPAATLASFSGTYTFQMVQLKDYSIETNMAGQQVGFCNGSVAGYGCWDTQTFDLLAGSIVADGAGHITSGNYTQTRDPNSYKCNPKNSPTSPCPVIVPSGHNYSTTTSYPVGYTVDFTVGSQTRTFQAVQKNVGKPPNWSVSNYAGNICSYNGSNLNTCYWTQIPSSLTSDNSGNSTGTITGTYTIQASGAGVMTLKPTNCGDCGTVQLAFTVSPTSQVGQTISLSGVPVLGDSNSSVGSGVRVK